MRNYYKQWIKTALSGAWGAMSVVSTFLGIVIAAITDTHPAWMGDRVLRLIASFGGWIIPIGIFSAFLLVRLILAPYWMHQEAALKIPKPEDDRTKLSKLLELVDRRFDEILKNALTLQMNFPNNPFDLVVASIEPEIISDLYQSDDRLNWHEFRDMAQKLEQLNVVIVEFRKKASPDNLQKLQRLIQQVIRPIPVTIQKQMISRFP
jgi:hypothetical protein